MKIHSDIDIYVIIRAERAPLYRSANNSLILITNQMSTFTEEIMKTKIEHVLQIVCNKKIKSNDNFNNFCLPKLIIVAN